jgi:hypothetical protein
MQPNNEKFFLANKEKSDKARNEYESRPKNCLNCGVLIPYTKRVNNFCCRSCSATYNNRGINRWNTELKFCEICGKQINPRNKRCCGDCKQALVEKDAENGKLKQRESLKKILARRYGYKCSLCGLTEWLGNKILLLVDHVDGHPENNRLDNLRLVCSNCDATLPTYKGRNIGNGRKFRRTELLV